MTAKKHHSKASSPKTKKGRPNEAAPRETVPSQAPLQAEDTSVEPLPAPAAPTPELSMTATPMAAEGEITSSERTSSDQTEKTTRLSALDAAAKVLGESGQAMNCQELITVMAAKGYWSSPHGKTPSGTLYSAILREVQTKKEQARFRKSQRGKFELRPEG